MGTGYTRNDTLNNIADGNIINASDLDGEYDAIESAFNESTGHTHDGTAAEGAPITVLGPVQDFIASATEIKPKTTNTLDIGTVSLQFKDMYLDGTAYIDGLGEDILVATDKKVQFRDTALFINSSADGQLDIDADVELELVAPTVDIDASTAVTIDTATLTVTGSANVVGDLDIDNINIDGNTISSTDTNGNINLVPNGTGEVNLTDNDKLTFGAGSDLQIYHDGTNSYIEDAGDGSLFIKAQDFIILEDTAGDNYFAGQTGGAATLYHAGSAKLGTTATGVDVTGTVTADGILYDAETNFSISSNGGTILDIDANNNGAENLWITHGGGNDIIAKFETTGDISFYEDTGTSAKLFWDASAEFLGVGTSSPNSVLHLSTSNDPQITLTDTGFGASADITGSNGNLRLNSQTATIFDMAGSEVVRIDSNGRLGIGTSSPVRLLHLNTTSGTDGRIHFTNATTGTTAGDGFFIGQDGGDGKVSVWSFENDYMRFATNNTERMRITNGGIVLVGKTSTTNSVAGIELNNTGQLVAAFASGTHILGRNTTDGSILQFNKNSTTVGSIGTYGNTTFIQSGASASYAGLLFNTSQIEPTRADGSSGSNPRVDNVLDLGSLSYRFDDVYATNGTIQTSDANEKQQIAALTDAEITAAKAISQLFKTFKWNSAVEAKGDAARTHTGVIAQDVEAAMIAAGLDAGDYAFFISSTWYVDADGNEVEADAEGAIEKNRKGIRYPELLAFVSAATEQRLANIETRLAALEAN